MTNYEPLATRYDNMQYRRCGRSGLMLPAISLGLWQNFGAEGSRETQRAILRRAVDEDGLCDFAGCRVVFQPIR